MGAFPSDDLIAQVTDRTPKVTNGTDKVPQSKVTWRGDKRGERTLDWGDCPGPYHAFEFLRFGLMDTKSPREVDARRKSDPASAKLYRRGPKAKDFFDRESMYNLGALCKGIGTGPEVQAWITDFYDAYELSESRGVVVVVNRKRTLPFGKERVHAAIAETRGAWGAPPKHADASVAHGGEEEFKSSGPLCGPSGEIELEQEGRHFRLAGIVRPTGARQPWGLQFELHDGEQAIAVKKSGDADGALVVVTSPAGTRLLRAGRDGALADWAVLTSAQAARARFLGGNNLGRVRVMLLDRRSISPSFAGQEFVRAEASA
ncbi:hypothetical protein Noca_1040 [Nocardioides sp. JS614]|nr:hypothetical protein Noca_1040 [Nocardioides sp. JS614]